MPTVKIRDLPYITSLQANTSNTVLVGVDIPSNYTGQMTLTTLAAGLYSNNRLVVGNYIVDYPNTIAMFANSSVNYVQTIIENTNDYGTADLVAQANVSTDTSHFIDFGFTGNNYNNLSPFNSLGTSINQLDGYLYVQGLEGSKGGNLVIGTASSNTRINFIVGGVNSQNVVAYMTTSGIFSNSINSLVAANVATIRSEVTANAASANSVINTRISANIATANLFTQAAFDKANNALANTSGTFAGNLTVTGNIIGQSINTSSFSLTGGTANISGTLNVIGAVTMNSTLDLINTNFSATDSAVTIRATANVQTPSNDGYMLHISGKQDIPSRIVFDSFGTNTYGVVAGRTARGTVDSPTAVQANDVLMRVTGNGWGSTGFAPLGVARIDIVATETYTDTKRGSQIKFYNIPTGSNVVTNIATFNGDSAQFTGVVNPQKGMVMTPNVVSGITNTLNIDIANNSLYKVNINNTVTVNLSGYQYGKIVEVWMTNLDTVNHTVTHGCLANNSTVNGTTFTLKATSSAYLRYFSIDGDNANTFVAISFS